MNRKYVYALSAILFIAFLIAALLVWDAIHLDSGRKVYEVSVVVRSKQSSYWNAVKQGIDQAVSDMTVDLSYVTLENENDAQEQAAAIIREAENGASAIVVAPCADVEVLQEAIGAAKRVAVIVEIESEAGSPSASVLNDNTALGAELAAELIRRGAQGKTYTVLLPKNPAGCVEERREAFEAAMLAAGAGIERQVLPGKPVPEDFLGTHYVALDADSLKDAMHAIAARNDPDIKLCGIGGGGEIAYFLESGVIEFTIADNPYILGYLGIKSAVAILNKEKTENRILMDFAVITEENMYEMDKQRVLFPFVK